jgi:hypothetical protein
MIVLSHEFDGKIIRTTRLWKPSDRIDTIIGEVLIGLFAQQSKKCKLYWTNHFVCYFKTTSQWTKPALIPFLFPRNQRLLSTKKLRKWRINWLYLYRSCLLVSIDASVTASTHIAEDMYRVIEYTEIWVNPIPTYHLYQSSYWYLLNNILIPSSKVGWA